MMKPFRGGYAEYVVPRGPGWVRWKLASIPARIHRLVRRAYRCCRPESEVSAYLGMGVRIIGEDMGRRLPVGSVGVVTGSELQDSGDRTYTVEFDTEYVTLSTLLPCTRHFELFHSGRTVDKRAAGPECRRTRRPLRSISRARP